MRRLIIFTLFAVFTATTFSQKGEIKWLTIEEADILIKKDPRPIFIDTYTDWCGWCKKMDQDTFSNPVIADILNNEFYPVKFNAEIKENISFLGQTFINDGKYGRAHQLAIALLNGRLSFPTVVFLTQHEGKYSVTPVPGFRIPKDMEVLLSFFSEKAYETQKWEDYQKNFVGKIQ